MIADPVCESCCHMVPKVTPIFYACPVTGRLAMQILCGRCAEYLGGVPWREAIDSAHIDPMHPEP